MMNPNFNIVEESKEQGYSRFVFEPLEPGFGNTLGVALRRVLLTSIEGAAVTSISINGVKHMFSTLPGLKEDVIELIMNIKALKVKLADGTNEAKISLSKAGPGEVTAADIEASDVVEIVDPEHYLGSLSDKKSKLDIEMTVERGLGYSLAEERKISTVGVIPIDAIYSPIIKVIHKVEQTRVGRQTNYDKLILEMWTDGTVDAREVLNSAAQILVSYFTQVYAPREEGAVETTSNVPSSIPEELLNMTIDELDLPTRIYNSLRNAGIETIRALLATPRRDLMGYRNLGAKSLSIIDASLKEKGVDVDF
jgi:DNA-directed RNA polymerase subunit alpha